MFCPVAESLHCKPRWAAKAGIENSCLVDLTDLVGFHGTSGSSGRDSMRKLEPVGHWQSIRRWVADSLRVYIP